jgi:hypothetical protein
MRAMRPAPLLAIAAALAACAGAPRVCHEDVQALRSREGVCAATSFVNPAGRDVRIRGCLRVGSAGTPFDNDATRLVTELDAAEPADAELADWQVVVLRDGEQLLNRALDAGPSHRRCSGFGMGCRQRIADVAVIDRALGAGTYTLRYRMMSEQAFVAARQPPELTIVLQ